jgi:mannan endo-1,4-beta-mannosidase
VVNQWQGGFQGEVKVTAGSAAITGWTTTWTFANGQSVSQSWNATLSNSGSSYTARNVDWNGRLGAGASTTFGFIGSWNGTNATPAVTCAAR